MKLRRKTHKEQIADLMVTIAERQLDILKLKGENAELNFKLKQAVKILKECAAYEDLTCYSDILEEIETFLKSVDNIII